MKNIKLSHEDYQIFLLKALLWLGLAWGGFAFALVGFFYASLIWVLFGAAAIYFTKKALDIGLPIRISRELLTVSIVLLVVVISFSAFSTPSVFTGRDQGSFSTAAISLAQNHQLKFSTPTSDAFFKLHESGRALNFPGFYYTKSGELVTQFSLVYIAWLALFFAIFGVTGFAIANGLLLYTFFLSFYLLLRLFLKTSSAWPMMLLTVTSSTFMWFSKFTLSENMALAVLWTSILALMLFLKNQRKLYYLVLLFSLFLLCFTRIEGIAFLIATVIIISLNKEARAFFQEHIWLRFFLPMLILLGVFIANIYVDVYFYKEILKAIMPTVSMPQAKYLGEIKNNALPAFYTGKIFYLYGLLGFFIFGAVGAAFTSWKKNLHKLVPFFVILPTLIYFFDSQISPDHPWMLRRFAFSLFPAAIFYTGLVFGKLFEIAPHEKKLSAPRVLAGFIFAALLAMNLPAFLKYFAYSENANLLTQVQTLSNKFSDNDLILIDQQASGDGWSMLAGPMNSLYGKNAVYFFNNQDLARLDTKNFSNVYLIAPSSKVPFYQSSTIGEKLKPAYNYKLSTTRLEAKQSNTLDGITLPERKDINITGEIFKVTK
ncbi:MAG: hypothetical protein HGA36_04195 [Candidatus Moranbacteria bacterium]|nr:hypothetical protein [Candidatus Moranbacteria bacterium]